MKRKNVMLAVGLGVLLPLICSLLFLVEWSDNEDGGNPHPEVVHECPSIIVTGPEEAVSSARVFAFSSEGEWIECERLKTGRFQFGSEIERSLGLVAISPDHISKPLDASGGKTKFVLELEASSSISVLVVGSDSEPIKAASIEIGLANLIESRLWVQANKAFGHILPITSNEDGRAEIRFIRPSQQITLKAYTDTMSSGDFRLATKKTNNVELHLDNSIQVTELTFKDHAGVPVPDLEVMYATASDQKNFNEAVVVNWAVTDAQGLARLNLADGSFFKILGVSEGWWLPPGFRKPQPSGKVFNVTVHLERFVEVHITFDDDQPYDGNAMVSADSRSWYAIAEAKVDSDMISEGGPEAVISKQGILRLDGVPIGVPLIISGEKTRLEYDRLRAKLTDVDYDDNSIAKVIIEKPDNNKMSGRFALVFQKSTITDEHIEIFATQSTRYRVDNFNLSARSESKFLTPGFYIIRVTGNSAWESGDLSLQGGEIRKVEIGLAPSGSVTATIVDSAGQPIKGAAIISLSRFHPSYPAEPKSGQVAVSDENGIIKLDKLPAGYGEFKLGAFNFQDTTIGLTIQSGTTNEYGNVILAGAEGEIIVVLEDSLPEGAELSVELISPLGIGGLVVAEKALKDGKCKFGSLSVGRLYILTIEYSLDGERASLIINGILPDEKKQKLEYRVKLDQFRFE